MAFPIRTGLAEHRSAWFQRALPPHVGVLPRLLRSRFPARRDRCRLFQARRLTLRKERGRALANPSSPGSPRQRCLETAAPLADDDYGQVYALPSGSATKRTASPAFTRIST